MSLAIAILGRIAPIFVVMAIGFAAFSLRWIDDQFIATANRITFRIALPSLVFLNVSRADFAHGIPATETLVYFIALLAATAAGYIFAAILRLPAPRRASMVQGSIRGNLAIVALAVFRQVLGPASLATASLYLAFFMLVHNLVGMTVLSRAVPVTGGRSMARNLWTAIVTSLANPLMVAIYLGILVALIRIELPQFVTESLDYLSQLTLPLALLGIGGAVREYSRAHHLTSAVAASVVKLLVMPAAALAAGILFHLPKEPLLMVVVFAASPAAVATYALADGMGADRDTAGSIVMVSHLLCIVTLTAAIVVVRVVGG